ncbi:MAG: hypothetical protein AMJ79_07120 [Phycisphaerae bacterium SM23_30]|nr:MAG: hypothetical protein AMJ79_07120 [Phycisphaerae bacterium SM23_30]
MDQQILKKPQIWAVVIPVLASLLALYATVDALSLRKNARKLIKDADDAAQKADDILTLLDQFGDSRLIGVDSRKFNDVVSARECAAAAGISSTQMERLAGVKSQKQKDGTILQGERYLLQNVSLLQVVQFIDYAERNFSSLNCSFLDLTPIRSAKTKDSWKAQLTLNYLEK